MRFQLVATVISGVLCSCAGIVSIGRAPEAEIFVPHPSVSRRHALLRLGDEPLLEDVGSGNGTAVTVNYPPRSGDYQSSPAIEVLISQPQPALFVIFENFLVQELADEKDDEQNGA